MKLRVIFLRKKFLYFLLLLIILVMVVSIFFAFKKSSPTFNINEDYTVKKADLTGDKKEDILYIRVNDSKYNIQVNSQDKSYVLVPNKATKTIGNFDVNWPMRVTLIDVTKDTIPEIFTQASDQNEPVIHVFKWYGNEFRDIFSSKSSILGFIDTQNNPRLITGNIINGNMELKNYYFSNNGFKLFNYENNKNTVGEDIIWRFIELIQQLPNVQNKNYEDIFYSKNNITDLSSIKKLIQNNNLYVFQDAQFKDLSRNKNGEITELEWLLNFRGISNTDKSQISNYTFRILLKPENKNVNPSFKIYSITIK